MFLIKRGAEANLYLGDFDQVMHPAKRGKVIIKHRTPKHYRLQELDEKLRESRTSLESKLFSDAKRCGVPTPVVYRVDLSEMKIVMEFIEGEQVKTVLDGFRQKKRQKVCEQIGKQVAKLHRGGIIHGDLTTSNMILKDGRVFFVDFGLGEYSPSIEARGVDLHLMRRALKSVHFRVAGDAYENILRGYRKELGKGAEDVIKRAEQVRRRGRYIQKEERILS
jgi:TP53 regulating kinase-like protein